MYSVTVERSFTAAHRHGGVPGDGLHGHDFLVLARLEGPCLVDDVLVDFHAVEVELARLLGELTHTDLGTHPAFAARSATPAAIARWIFDRLAPRIAAAPGVSLASIEVRDTERTGARYSRESQGLR